MPENSDNSLISIVKSMETAAILVVGDIMLDRFIYGAVERISPESPVPVLSIQREDKMLGGAGNALANLAGLGVSARILALIGDDADGAEIKRMVESMGADTGGLIVDPSRPTIVKTRYLAGHQQLLRTDAEKNTPLPAALAGKMLEKAEALLEGVSVIILSDYGKGVLHPDVIAGIIKRAQEKNIPVVVDPKGHDFSKYKGAAVITPNRKELSEATRGHAVSSDEEVTAAAGQIIKECGIAAVICTRSKDGMSVIQKNKAPLHLRGDDIEVFDVSGAGDTVIATLAAALAAGADLEEAAQLANIAGGIVVTKVGTAPIRASELIERSSERQGRQSPLLDWQAAAEQIKRWRARGLKVGFTNGCFDILHFGHVSYLNDARSNCDRLIVGLNRDASVRLLKGEGRPVHDEASRAAVLGSMGAIDMVVLFGAAAAGEDNTACAVLELLQPDIYFKGGDYAIEQIPEAPTVHAYGGEVALMPSFAGHSTTASLKKIKNEAA